MKTALTIAFVLLAACGSKKSAPTTTTPKTGGGEHGDMVPEVAKFHDVLAPRWHADKGPKRMTDTCGATAELQANADALGKLAPPAGTDAAVWTGKTQELTSAVGALDGTCKANDAAAFEPAFERVHTSFHAVMEATGGHKGGEHHGDHKM
ncbi:MAG: hypothetical protein H0T46_10520 [Deltaproteobacteria bacterium]|nr:hypothetical protein [Deltaproteobacteria bacterium]